MPFYEYRCSNCGFELEELQKMSDPPLIICPKCSKDTLQKLLGTGAGLIFKGSGFYLTDYKKKTSPEISTSKSTSSENSKQESSKHESSKHESSKHESSGKEKSVTDSSAGHKGSKETKTAIKNQVSSGTNKSENTNKDK